MGSVATQYKEVVGLTVTFKESEDRETSVKLLCVVLPGMGTDLIIGCPALDTLGYAASKDLIELRAHDIELPTVLPSETADNPIAVMTGPTIIQPGELREFWLPTNAQPGRSYTVKPAKRMRSGLVVAEGPARMEKGKVKVYLTTEGDEPVRLRPMERVAELMETKEEDLEEQRLLRAGRMEAFVKDSAALGPHLEDMMEHLGTSDRAWHSPSRHASGAGERHHSGACAAPMAPGLGRNATRSACRPQCARRQRCHE